MHQINTINNEEFQGKHNFLGNLLMQPAVNMTDSNRGQMFSAEFEQAIQIKEAEPPLVFTGFENQWGKYSSGYLELDGTWKVVARIDKNEFNYALIIKKLKDSPKEKKSKRKKKFEVGEYHVIFRTECTNLTEKYGYKHNNETIDSLEKGDIFEDEVLWKDNNRDDDMNFQYGKNLNAVYLSREETNEDSIIIAESVTKSMGNYFVNKVKVSLNTNDILTNLYGNKKFYKSFPDIGEFIREDGLLCSSRRINYQNAPIALINMKKPFRDDTNYITKGRVVDIKVVSNIDYPDEELDKPFNKQIKKYYYQEQNYYNNFVKYLTPIVTNEENKISNDLMYYYNRYRCLLDPANKFRIDGNLFDHLILEFTILQFEPLQIGSKLAGRYGDKGVISKIVPDDEMPSIVDFAGYGKPDEDSKINFKIQIILNPQGVPNRLNPSQNIEEELNYNSMTIRYDMEHMLKSKDEYTLDDVKDYLLDYYKVVDEKQYKTMKNFINSMKKKDDLKLEEFLWEIVEKGIPIHQAPFFGNHNIIDLAKVYKYTEAERTVLDGIKNSVVFGEKYTMVLKHTPISKFSARSIDQLSIKNLPVKSTLFKQHKVENSSTPIKVGEMEVIGLNVANPANKGCMKKVYNFLNAYANNETDRMNFLYAQCRENPFSFDFELSDTRSENSKILRSFLNCLQYNPV